MWDVIRGLVREGTTLLLTTQYLEEADELADTIAVVDHGKIIARGTADELKTQVGGERIEVVVHATTTSRARPRSSRPHGAARSRRRAHAEADPRRPAAARKRWSRSCASLDEADIEIDDIGVRRPTLDDVFLSLTGQPPSDEAHAASETGKAAA